MKIITSFSRKSFANTMARCLCIVLAAVFVSSVHAADWYVKAAAKDGGTGTKAKPFNSLADVEVASEDGDTIYIR